MAEINSDEKVVVARSSINVANIIAAIALLGGGVLLDGVHGGHLLLHLLGLLLSHLLHLLGRLPHLLHLLRRAVVFVADHMPIGVFHEQGGEFDL